MRRVVQELMKISPELSMRDFSSSQADQVQNGRSRGDPLQEEFKVSLFFAPSYL